MQQRACQSARGISLSSMTPLFLSKCHRWDLQCVTMLKTSRPYQYSYYQSTVDLRCQRQLKQSARAARMLSRLACRTARM